MYEETAVDEEIASRGVNKREVDTPVPAGGDTSVSQGETASGNLRTSISSSCDDIALAVCEIKVCPAEKGIEQNTDSNK